MSTEASGVSGLLSSAGPVAIALAVGAAPLLYVLWPRIKALFRRRKAKEEMPSDGVWDMATLAKFDGDVNPICLGVCGKVVDVSSSENIRYNEGMYGKLWAGRDATYSLATLSLKEEDVNKLDFQLTDFTKEQHKALAGWYKHFTTKYTVVGKLKEYEGWDFSSIEEEAKSQNPFGANDAAKAEEPAPAPDTGLVFAKGDKVWIRAVQGPLEEHNGETGILQGFNAEQKAFEVKLDSNGKVELFRPANLTKAS
eukprot:CAMPEP_0176223516 /NCGR_PEP_ID=MMETSP0121_2-20121125/20783_1 /TAXON_ID=160619 /ORGANISM="Kryptoperidinium foliaceum, Strain CCMP 1326" /LENGTH=252 /DNA_ID=CAMNT_0017562749 /DNA_START=1 /DNA_END=759 /DNA_ORIENTATION=-